MQSGARRAGVVGGIWGVNASEIVVATDPWAPIQLYSVYRLILAGMLLILSLTDTSYVDIGGYDRELFARAVNIYLGITILGVFLAHFRTPNTQYQIYLNSITDISFLLLVAYASGGLNSGLGILLLLPVILPSILNPGQVSLLLSATTVIALLGLETFMHAQNKVGSYEFFHTGGL